MLEAQKIRLSNRIETCLNEVKLAKIRLKSDIRDVKFWQNELFCAKAELHGMQLELNLRCSSCGD
ncbi:MAG: hypothetical protein [Arizlama microvirus]|nr:MAG: hypothetical protein [Arizlama microvirus]